MMPRCAPGALRSLFISPLGQPARERGKKAAARENFAWLVCALAKRLALRSFFAPLFAVKSGKKIVGCINGIMQIVIQQQALNN